MNKLDKGALRVTAIYMLLGGLWILFSDQLVNIIATDSQTATKLSTFKGWLFISFTGWLLYGLISQLLKEIAETQRALNENYQAIFNAANDGILVHDAETGEIIDRNAKALAMYNLSFDDNPNDIEEGMYPYNDSEVQWRIKQAATGQPQLFECIIKQQAGKPLWSEVSLKSAMIGERNCVLAVVRDISERKRHEDIIYRLNRLYDVLSRVNHTLVKARSRQELFHQVCQIAVEHGGFKLAWIGEHDRDSHAVRQVAWAGEPAEYIKNLVIFSDERPEGLGPTGSAVREGKTYVCNDFFADSATSPWRNKAKQAGIGSSAVFVFYCGGIVAGALNVYASEANVFQEKEVALLEEVAAALSFGIAHLEEEAQRKRVEEALREVNDDLEKKVEVRTQELMGMNEELMAMNEEMMVMNEKINQSKEEAEQANSAKSDFLAKMSHEIRTPINAIVGLNYLMKKTKLTDKQQEYVEKATLSANNLQLIINDILDFSKIEANKVVLEHADFDLYEVLHNISNIISVKVYEKNLKLHFSVDAAAPQFLKGDFFRLQQILLNLANNAVKFTAAGEISIAVAVEKEEEGQVFLEFTVQDTGIGIPVEQQSDLFKAFSQIDTSTTRKYGGTGLGLAICKTLIELMGGTIQVVSEPGRGSRFRFTLPFVYCRDHKLVTTIAPNLQFLRILLVCSNLEMRRVLQNQVEQFGFICSVFESGVQAIESIGEARRYDLIFIDQRLHDMDGRQTAERIREETGLSVPIIMLVSAYREGELQSPVKIDSAGFNGILYYPVGQSQLYNVIVKQFESVLLGEDGKPVDVERHNRFLALKHTRVLLVEDNEINQQVAKDILEDAEIVVDIAQDGSKAVDLVAVRQYDIVLMDIQMPVMDGYEAAKRIRDFPHAQELPIIALTADVVKGVDDKVLAAGMNGYITKPIEPIQLLSTLKRWMQKERVSYNQEQVEPDRVIGCAGENFSQNAGTITLPLQQLPGLNTEAGLARLHGKTERYLELLGIFREKEVLSYRQIKEALVQGNTALAIRFAHTLKGAAGNIGGEDVFQIAAALEQGLREDAGLSQLEEQLEELTGALRIVDHSIEIVLQNEKNSEETIPTELTEEIKTLATLIEMNLVEAFDLFMKILPKLERRYGQDALGSLRHAIINFDWDAAGQLLNNLEKPYEIQ